MSCLTMYPLLNWGQIVASHCLTHGRIHIFDGEVLYPILMSEKLGFSDLLLFLNKYIPHLTIQ